MMQSAYALNTKGLKAGSVYALNEGYTLNNGVRLTTRVYGRGIHNEKLEHLLEVLLIVLKQRSGYT